MSKEIRKNIMRLGMALAVATSAAACKKETDQLPQNHYSIKPGECELIPGDIWLCNKANKNTRNATFQRFNNGIQENFGPIKLRSNQHYVFKGFLEGLSLELDREEVI
ncbi:hypothetical protein HY503_00360 [Candidatus Woesebacteria bacterium]|nr:hypothetical protein [Candidatus Woesebacteria bacterium]